MMRLIKMELYRLLHTISTYVMIVVVAGVAVLITLLLKVELSTTMVVERETTVEEIGAEPELPAKSFANGFSDGWASSGEKSTEDDFTYGITVSADESWESGDIRAGAILMSQLNSCLLVVFVAIFVPLFVNAEQKRGYIKNIAGQIPRREMLALSKMPAVAVQVFMLFTAYSIAYLIAEAVLFRERIVWVSVGVLLRTLCMQYVLHTAWGCLIAFFTIMTRSTAFAMTTGILLASGIAQMLFMYLNRAICAIIPSAEQLNLVHYTLNYATGAATTQSTMRQLGGCAVLAVIYIVISAVLAGIVYRKRDVR